MNRSTKTCHICGANLPENARFCPNCGTSAEGTAFAQTSPPYNAGAGLLPYGVQPYPASNPPQPQSNAKAIAGLVLGILSLVTLNIILAILGLIFSCFAQKDAKGKSNGIATAGLVFAVIAMILWAIGIVLFFIWFFLMIATDGFFIIG